MTDRRLIEDYIPIREISAETSREKSLRNEADGPNRLPGTLLCRWHR